MSKVFYNGEVEVSNAICGCCGNTHDWEDYSCEVYEGKFICSECYQNLFGFCNECDNLYRYEDMNEDIICKSCSAYLENRENCNKSYLVCIADNSDFYIPNAEHIERNDELFLVEDDEQASIEAEKDGIKLIYGMNDVPDGVYIDTNKNRAVIHEMLKKYPEYRKWGVK